jgi:hypothetical protein
MPAMSVSAKFTSRLIEKGVDIQTAAFWRWLGLSSGMLSGIGAMVFIGSKTPSTSGRNTSPTRIATTSSFFSGKVCP